jgi:4-hydroxy-L-threonine phosphate dehydrogenase PdxA
MRWNAPGHEARNEAGESFQIAWPGQASPNSLIEAVLWAVRLTGTR